MADRHSSSQYFQPRRPTTTTGSHDDQSPGAAFMWRIQNHQRPSSAQTVGLLTLAITGGILLLLTGITITATFMGIILFSPFLFITSPIWVPFAALTFFVVAGFLSMFGFGLVAVAAVAWVYRYFRGFNPPGSDRVDYARNRIADTASHVKDYAREYGGFSQNKVKDAAPGA